MRSAWLLVGFLLAGCRFEMEVDATARFYCGSEGSCPSGQSCVADWCRLDRVEPVDDADVGELPDAGPGDPDAELDRPDADPADPDAASIPDAGIPDASPPPDAMPVCRIEQIADDFGDSAVSPFWEAFNELPTVATETAGRLVISLATNTSGSHFAGYVYRHNTDARGQRVMIDVIVPPNPAGDANAFFKVQNGTNYNHQVTFVLEAGVLYMDTYDANYNRLSRRTLTFNASTHRYWAIAESGGQVEFQTSPDGISWTTRETQPAPFSFLNGRLAFGGGTWKAESSPGTVQFNRVGEGATADCFGAAP